MARVSTMVNAISLLWLQGWHAPAGRRTCETPASSQARQIVPAVPVGAMNPGPGRQIVSQDNPIGVSRFGGQAGTQAPDPNAPSSQSQGGRAGSITYILPAESARLRLWICCSDSRSRLVSYVRAPRRRHQQLRRHQSLASVHYLSPLWVDCISSTRVTDPAQTVGTGWASRSGSCQTYW